MITPPEDLSPLTLAARWTSRIFSVCLEMMIPGLIGYWLDGWLGSTPWLMLSGFAVGAPLAMWHLIQMTSERPKGTGSGMAGNSGTDGEQEERDPSR
ncbi:MAG: AtpZ/AtpI family protein [Pirellulales bacterium]